MLKREIESILAVINQPWSSLLQQESDAYRSAVSAAEKSMMTDARFEALRAALRMCGVVNDDGVAWGLCRAPSGSMSSPVWTTKSLKADIQAAAASVTRPSTIGFYGDPSYAALNIALASSTMKWAALQPSVYVLISELNSAKTYDNLRKAVIDFTAAITK